MVLSNTPLLEISFVSVSAELTQVVTVSKNGMDASVQSKEVGMWSKTQFLFPSVLKVQIKKFHGQFWLTPNTWQFTPLPHTLDTSKQKLRGGPLKRSVMSSLKFNPDKDHGVVADQRIWVTASLSC